MATFIRSRVLSGEVITGTFINLGSHITAEMSGHAGFDLLVLDTEHGLGDHESLVHQLQATSATPAVPIVRVTWHEVWRFKRALDAGAMGVMVPFVQTPDEAREIVKAMRYAPDGVRGFAASIRANRWGMDAPGYYHDSNRELLTIIQIETPEGVANADEIASVDGVDVLFVGPADLTTTLGVQGQFDHPSFIKALETVKRATDAHGKAAGILCHVPNLLETAVATGYTFLCYGSDGGAVMKTMSANAAMLDEIRKRGAGG